MMDSQTLDYLVQLSDRLNHAKHGNKKSIIEQASTFLNCSVPQVYRLLDKAGLTIKRKTRSDKGKIMITQEQAQYVSGALLAARRANSKKLLSIKDINQIAYANNIIPKMSASTLANALRRYHLHPDQLAIPKAHVRTRSLYPNHVWQIDASVCVLFYLPKTKKGGLSVMDEAEFYKNKPQNIVRTIDERVTRYVITDHYSGAIYVEYVHGTESSENITQVFLNAIQRRSPQELMYGIPEILVMDKGSANMSGLFLNLLDRLGVRHYAHATGNSRAKGQVEKANDIVERKFESRLSMMNIANLEQLNDQVSKWRTYFNANEKHSRHGKTRNQVWHKIVRTGKLKLAPSPEICRELVSTKPKAMKVRGDLTVTYTIKGFGNQSYDVRHIDGIYPKAQVHITLNPYRVPDIDVLFNDKVYTVCPIQLDEAGFDVSAAVIGETMASHKDNIADQNRKTLYELTYAVSSEAEVQKQRKKRAVVAFAGKIDAMADIRTDDVNFYLVPNGQAISTQVVQRELKPLSHVEAAKSIKSIIGDLWTAEHYRYLVTTYPDGVPAEDLETIANQLSNSQDNENDNFIPVAI